MYDNNCGFIRPIYDMKLRQNESLTILLMEVKR